MIRFKYKDEIYPQGTTEVFLTIHPNMFGTYDLVRVDFTPSIEVLDEITHDELEIIYPPSVEKSAT